ncbi:hypothetical protein ACFXGI_05205 [Streptomyces sp. NPDC059355]|uniref:hypothetical protein n=1 Tax=Streptomyces sp. NPDC059355 TaxID=3346811 RepID=UPI0036AF3E2F
MNRSHTWVIAVRLAAGYRGDGSDIVNEPVVGAQTADPDQANDKTSLDGPGHPAQRAHRRSVPGEDRAARGRAQGRQAVRPGEKFVYLITAHNHGPATERTVQVGDLLPPSLTLLSSPDDCAVPEGEDRLVVCPPRERLEAGAKAEFRITVKAKDKGAGKDGRDGADRGGDSGHTCVPIDNIARVTSATFDPDLADNANRPGTTGPGGGPPCLETGTEDHHARKPDGLAYVTSSPTGCTVSGHLVSCKRTSLLKAGDFTGYVLTVRVDPSYSGDGSDLRVRPPPAVR